MSVPSLRERRFELQLHPTLAGDSWGFRLSETFGDAKEAVTKVDATRATQFRRAVLEAVEASGYPPAAVSPRRCRPFNLQQDPGVRLALTVCASLPVARPLRRRAIVDGVGALSPEEALYWYARTSGPERGRALRALRLLLADD
ncbi:MAG: hypothetical protein OXI97_18465 [Acidimicrobiaceae bacterium]|nr:hypothetical protein [Acidimicrobiaceae bacterium]